MGREIRLWATSYCSWSRFLYSAGTSYVACVAGGFGGRERRAKTSGAAAGEMGREPRQSRRSRVNERLRRDEPPARIPPPPKFTYLTTCRYPINPTNQMADGKMKPSRLAIKTYPGNSICFFRWRQMPTLRKSLSRDKSFPVLQQVSMITVDCALASGDNIVSHFIIVGIGF